MECCEIVIRGLVNKVKSEGKSVAKADEIFKPIWDQLNDTEKRTLGKKFYDDVVANKINGVTLNRKNAAGRAYYNL